MDIITADGGFDFSSDFNNQEKLACNLIFAEICFAILTQKKGGNFIIKFFDIFTLASVDLLYILSCFYTNIAITKPCTSRTFWQLYYFISMTHPHIELIIFFS